MSARIQKEGKVHMETEPESTGWRAGRPKSACGRVLDSYPLLHTKEIARVTCNLCYFFHTGVKRS